MQTLEPNNFCEALNRPATQNPVDERSEEDSAMQTLEPNNFCEALNRPGGAIA
jgi:hypothetical protein